MGISLGKVASLHAGPVGAVLYDKADKAADEAAAEAGSYHDQDLSGDTKGIIQGQYDRASRTDDQFADAALDGVDQTPGLLRAQNQDMHGQALGNGPDGGLQDAINRKASKSYDVALNNIQRREKSNAPMNRFNAMDNAQRGLEADRQIQMARVNRQMVARNNADAARNGVISSVLSIGGTVAGGVVGGIAGGPQGGMMGAQVGGTVGGSMAGNTQMQTMGGSQ